MPIRQKAGGPWQVSSVALGEIYGSFCCKGCEASLACRAWGQNGLIWNLCWQSQRSRWTHEYNYGIAEDVFNNTIQLNVKHITTNLVEIR